MYERKGVKVYVCDSPYDAEEFDFDDWLDGLIESLKGGEE